MREAVIVEALRTPIGRGKPGKGDLSSFHPAQLLAKVFDAVVERVGGETAERLRDLTLEIYASACRHAEGAGILLADTKFEFGQDDDGNIVLADEVLTPDSSRFWPVETYAPGHSPESFDKQFVRNHLEGIGWNKQPPAPALPPDITAKTAEKYEEARARLVDGA